MTTPRLVMLVGAPRSGTTWLQTLLGAHDSIATPQETDLFRVYLEPLVAAWDKQLSGATDEDARRRKGLPLTLTQQQFDAAAAQLLTTTLDAVQRMKPSAAVVVEKSPAHSLCVDTILRFAPDAHFLHIVRDGRDAVASLLAASDSWGSRWAPDSVARGARVWRDHLLGAREARTRASSYLEIQYEDLRGSRGPELLATAYAIAGIELSQADTECVLEQHSFERQAQSGQVSSSILLGGEAGTTELARREPEGFFRKGTIGGWQEEWSVHDRRAFASVAGDLLIELGYERDDSWVGARTRPSLLTRARHRFANSTARGLRALADRVERLPVRR